MESWTRLIEILSTSCRVLYIERMSSKTTVKEYVAALHAHLLRNRLDGPYILVAHSYGGVFAKQFLKGHRELVAGMVLVETGKAVDKIDRPDEHLARRRYLGTKPLSVIRGNSLLRHQADLDARISEMSTTSNDSAEWLVAALEQDEKFEKAQLRLSSNHRFVDVPDCGHNVVRDRPDVVAREVKWVCDNLMNERHEESWLTRVWQLLYGVS